MRTLARLAALDLPPCRAAWALPAAFSGARVAASLRRRGRALRGVRGRLLGSARRCRRATAQLDAPLVGAAVVVLGSAGTSRSSRRSRSSSGSRSPGRGGGVGRCVLLPSSRSRRRPAGGRRRTRRARHVDPVLDWVPTPTTSASTRPSTGDFSRRGLSVAPTRLRRLRPDHLVAAGRRRLGVLVRAGAFFAQEHTPRSPPSRRWCRPRWPRSSPTDRAASRRPPTCAGSRSASTAPTSTAAFVAAGVRRAGLGNRRRPPRRRQFNQVPALSATRSTPSRASSRTSRACSSRCAACTRSSSRTTASACRPTTSSSWSRHRPAARRRRLPGDGAPVRRRPHRRDGLGKGPPGRRGRGHAPPLRRRLPRDVLHAERARHAPPPRHPTPPEAAWARFGAGCPSGPARREAGPAPSSPSPAVGLPAWSPSRASS